MDENQPQEEAAPAPLLTGPKRQHYLTRWYLEGFVGADDCVAVYDRERREVRRQQPVNTAVTGHLYTVTDEQGRKRFELEQALSQIEDAAARNMPKLLAGERIPLEARAAIAHFVGMLAVRTPEFIQTVQALNGDLVRRTTEIMFSSEDHVAAQLRRDPEHLGKSDAEIQRLAQDMVDFIKGGNYEIDTKHEWAMSMALSLGDKIAEIFVERHWAVWRAPAGAAFVCSDSPIILTSTLRRPSFYGIGYGSAEALVIVPLNSECALAMYGDGRTQNETRIDRRTVRQVNVDLARQAQRFLIARDNALVEAVSRAARMDETAWRPKLAVSPAPRKMPARMGPSKVEGPRRAR